MRNTMKIPKLCRYTKAELEYFIDRCNFTDEELEYFNHKAKDKTITAISYEMNVSEAKVSKIARNVKSKIIRVLSSSIELKSS